MAPFGSFFICFFPFGSFASFISLFLYFFLSLPLAAFGSFASICSLLLSAFGTLTTVKRLIL